MSESTTATPSSAPSEGSSPSLMFGWIVAVGLLFIWSGWVVISRYGVIQALTIYDIVALRFLVALIAVSPVLWKFWPRDLPAWKLLVLSGCTGVPFLLIAFAGMQFAPASHAGILLNGTLPIFAAIITWIGFRHSPGPAKILGMVVILAGCMLIGWDRGSDGLRPDAWIGHVLFTLASLLLAIYMILTKLWNIKPLQALVVVPTLNATLYLPVYLMFLPKAVTQAPWSEIWLQGLYQGLGPSVVGLLSFTFAVRILGSTRTAAIMAGVPALVALMAIPTLGEWPSLLAWSGLVVTTAGILLSIGSSNGEPGN